jgi:hypothetical protein
MGVDEEGRPVMLALVNSERGLRIEFDPPLVLAPAQLSPGMPTFTSTAKADARVVATGDRRDSGDATLETTVVGVSRVRPPTADAETQVGSASGGDPGTDAGVLALEVRTVFEARLDRSTVVRETTRWVAPSLPAGRQLVAERYEVRTSVFGVVVSREIGWLRREALSPAGLLRETRMPGSEAGS